MAQFRLFLLEDGTCQIFGDEGSFEEVKAGTEKILALLAAKGLPMELVGEIEQHRDDGPSHVHLVQTQRKKVDRG